jgi:hypothetical protein
MRLFSRLAIEQNSLAIKAANMTARSITAAHKKIPFGTKVKVINLENDRSVIIKINDRMATSQINNSNIHEL